MPLPLPEPLSLTANEHVANAYAAALTEACAAILHKPVVSCHDDAEAQARLWLLYLGHMDFDPAKRQEIFEKFGQGVRDEEAARRAIALWERVQDWHAAELARNPRFAMRHLMSDLSEEAYCASWHFDTEYRLWELLNGERESWMRLDKSDPRLGELRRLHEATGGWWWRNDKLNGGWGAKEFLLTEEWEKVYALCVDDRDRAIWAVIGGKLLKGQAAVDATAKLFKQKP
jgi:hypothetical protein